MKKGEDMVERIEGAGATYSWANSGCEGKRSIDSTRYWYDSASPARILPMMGMNWNEYCRYTLSAGQQ